LAGWPAELATSASNQLSQYANSPGHRAYCYAELAVSSLAVAVTIASTHFAYPRRDDQAELAWVAWLNTPRTVTYLSINPARRRVTMAADYVTNVNLGFEQFATAAGIYAATNLL